MGETPALDGAVVDEEILMRPREAKRFGPAHKTRDLFSFDLHHLFQKIPSKETDDSLPKVRGRGEEKERSA